MSGPRRPRRPGPHRSETVELTLGAPAAGGTCVAHGVAADATYFVRGGLPGERVLAETTGATRGGRVRFATVVQVLAASPDRVEAPCPAAGTCGGCDFQHVGLSAQRQWKARVLRDQLRRLGGIEAVDGVPLDDAVTVAAVPLDGRNDSGGDAASADIERQWRGWRTRVVVDADRQGRAGFHGHRSHHVVAVDGCPVVSDELQALFSTRLPPGSRVHASVSDQPTGWAAANVSLPEGWRRRAWVNREALGRTWRVATDGFWQAHRQAPDTLAGAVVRAASLSAGERALDLYSGVGLFAAALALSTQPHAEVLAVEGAPGAVRLARRNLHDLPSINVIDADVRRYPFDQPVAVTVLDPPRSGAGTRVVDEVARVTSRTIVHVGCDGAATARDVGRLVAAGWRLTAFEAFDLFPMTHHVETVATLQHRRDVT